MQKQIAATQSASYEIILNPLPDKIQKYSGMKPEKSSTYFVLRTDDKAVVICAFNSVSLGAFGSGVN